MARVLNPLDYVSGARTIIDFAHHELHDGSSFVTALTGTAKNDGTVINIYLKTPGTAVSEKRVHLLARASASGAAWFRIKEGIAPTGTTAQAIYNRARESSTTSVVYDNAGTPVQGRATGNITHTGGTEIYTSLIPGAGKSAGGESRAEAEFILAPNTGYVFEVESDASGLTLGLELDWYEHATSFVL